MTPIEQEQRSIPRQIPLRTWFKPFEDYIVKILVLPHVSYFCML